MGGETGCRRHQVGACMVIYGTGIVDKSVVLLWLRKEHTLIQTGVICSYSMPPVLSWNACLHTHTKRTHVHIQIPHFEERLANRADLQRKESRKSAGQAAGAAEGCTAEAPPQSSQPHGRHPPSLHTAFIWSVGEERQQHCRRRGRWLSPCRARQRKPESG